MVPPRVGVTLVIMGGSGSGKTVLLRTLAGLIQPNGGVLRVFGIDITALSEEALQPIRRRMGNVFQGAALFASLTVADNVACPLRENTSLPINVDEEPLTCVVRGTGRILDDPEKYRGVLTLSRH